MLLEPGVRVCLIALVGIGFGCRFGHIVTGAALLPQNRTSRTGGAATAVKDLQTGRDYEILRKFLRHTVFEGGYRTIPTCPPSSDQSQNMVSPGAKGPLSVMSRVAYQSSLASSSIGSCSSALESDDHGDSCMRPDGLGCAGEPGQSAYREMGRTEFAMMRMQSWLERADCKRRRLFRIRRMPRRGSCASTATSATPFSRAKSRTSDCSSESRSKKMTPRYPRLAAACTTSRSPLSRPFHRSRSAHSGASLSRLWGRVASYSSFTLSGPQDLESDAHRVVELTVLQFRVGP